MKICSIRNKNIRTGRLFSIAFFLFLFLGVSSSCSFNYKDSEKQQEKQPDILFSYVTLRRYTNDRRELEAKAEELEMYDSEKLWIGNAIAFTQYDLDSQKETVKGKTGLMLINEPAEEYYLGNGVFFHLIEEDYAVRSSALVWKKKEALLAAPLAETVEITQGKDISIKGKSFAANTQTKTFMFKTGTTGTIVIDEKEDSEKNN